MKNKASINLKKITSYALALLMIFSNFAFFPTTKATATPTLTIGSQTASNGDTINVPINASDFSAYESNVGSVTLNIQYDNTLLTYINTTFNNLPIAAQANLVGNNKIVINWADATAVTPITIPNGALVTLNFNVISSTTTNTNLSFVDTNEVTDGAFDPISQVSFVDDDGVITLNPDITAPLVSSYTLNGLEQNVVFNPNDPASVSIVINADEPIKFTRIKILNSASEEVKFFTESASFVTTATKIWHGKNASDTVVPDGVYTLQVNIKDVADNTNNNLDLTPYTITVDTATPDTTAPNITLNGSNPVTIEVGTTYNDARATALDNVDGDITENIITVNPVNSNVVGTYTVTYNVTDSSGNHAQEATRTVNVTPDATAPVITLLGQNPVNLYVGDSYSDGGATAADNIDGDISSNIVTTGLPINTAIPGAYTITYNVLDAAGNSATKVTRTVNVVDVSTPIITLLGENPITIEVGAVYSDAGATATDDVDGDITANIIRVNHVNSNIVGTYTITYNVSDSSGNHAQEATRTVNVTPDATAPVITLNGGNKSIYQGTIYADLGAAALDNIDGNITANIITTGLPVDTTAPGVYTIAYNVLDAAGNPAIEITRTVTVLSVEQGQALIEENMTINTSAPEILIGDNAPISASINVPATVTNAQLNISALVSGDTVKSAIISSNLTVNSDTIAGQVNMQIPQGIQINGDSSWTGEINLPQVQENSSVNVTSNSGYTADVSSVIEIGFGNTKLNFNKAVRIKITNQAGKYVGYSRNGIFTPITNVCSVDSQIAGDALPAEGDCKISVGSDLIIWTKHFTKFVTYTQTAIPAPSGGGGFNAPAFTAPVEGLNIAINGGAKTANSENVVLTLNGGSQAQRMAISNSADFAASSQESYAATKNWTLSKGDGNKTVYVKFYNSYGSPSSVISASIQLDAVPAAPLSSPVQAVLGIKIYDNGALIRGTDKKIYLVNNGKLQYIANLRELAKYAGKEILNVKDDVIASYGQAVLGVKTYADNSLIRGTDKKIYVIINGKKKHVIDLNDLRKNHFGKVINNVSDSVLNQY